MAYHITVGAGLQDLDNGNSKTFYNGLGEGCLRPSALREETLWRKYVSRRDGSCVGEGQPRPAAASVCITAWAVRPVHSAPVAIDYPAAQAFRMGCKTGLIRSMASWTCS